MGKLKLNTKKRVHQARKRKQEELRADKKASVKQARRFRRTGQPYDEMLRGCRDW